MTLVGGPGISLQDSERSHLKHATRASGWTVSAFTTFVVKFKYGNVSQMPQITKITVTGILGIHVNSKTKT